MQCCSLSFFAEIIFFCQNWNGVEEGKAEQFPEDKWRLLSKLMMKKNTMMLIHKENLVLYMFKDISLHITTLCL